MKKTEETGFDYYLSDEAIKNYREKPLELRLRWLYMGNLLRMGYDKKIIEIQDRGRKGGVGRLSYTNSLFFNALTNGNGIIFLRFSWRVFVPSPGR